MSENLTHSDRISRTIESEIISGKRAPGSHLNEQEIANRFSVSRTPVREAVRQLSAAGLVEVKPQRGAFVAEIPVQRLLQMFEVMEELEALSARLAARRMTPEQKDTLKETHEAYSVYATRETADQYYEESQAFHQLIFKGSQNEVLEGMATKLSNQLTGYRRRQLNRSKRTETSFQEHSAVLEAILDGDEDAAERLMRAHTGIVGDNVIELLAGFDLKDA